MCFTAFLWSNVVNQPLPEAATPQLDRKTRVKSILGGSAGNLVEWYDWYVYAAFTLYFASKFFPKGDDTVKLLLFCPSFFNTPIGA